MAEYTLGQVIDKLGRNPNLKFKHIGGEYYSVGNGDVIHLNKNNRIVNESDNLVNFALDSRFVLVNEPVDAMVAFEAFHRGRTIYCEYAGVKFYYDPSSEYGDCALADIKGDTISVGEILFGKWFIEEGEKC